MDLRERRQLDVAQQVARVKQAARPWRWFFAVVLAIAAAATSRSFASPGPAVEKLLKDADIGAATARAISYAAAAAFFVLATAATMGLSANARDRLQRRIGSTHASLVRLVLVLVGLIVTITVTLSLFGLPVTQLVLGGAIVGVLLGIAAQQTLANLFAGIVLLQAHPFEVGENVWIRSGALGGQYEGTVAEIGLTYVRLRTENGPVVLPNTQVLAAATGPLKPAPADDAAGAADRRDEN